MECAMPPTPPAFKPRSRKGKIDLSPPTIQLTSDIATAIQSREIPPDWSSTSLPVRALPIPDPDADELRRHVLDSVFGEPGWAVIDTGLSACENHDLTGAVWNLFVTLFGPVPQYRSGELLYPVEVSGDAPRAASHYSQAAKSGGFHTDGTLLDEAPDVAALAGITTADEGGETVVVDGRPIVRTLNLRRSHLETLMVRHPFHSGDPGDPVVWHPIVVEGGPTLVLKYMRRYIELGYETVATSLPRGLAEAMDELDAAISVPANQSAVLIERGQMLVWNNAHCLHGRREFTELTRRRRLLRMYGARTPLDAQSQELE
jgi:hypothetical protein